MCGFMMRLECLTWASWLHWNAISGFMITLECHKWLHDYIGVPWMATAAPTSFFTHALQCHVRWLQCKKSANPWLHCHWNRISWLHLMATWELTWPWSSWCPWSWLSWPWVFFLESLALGFAFIAFMANFLALKLVMDLSFLATSGRRSLVWMAFFFWRMIANHGLPQWLHSLAWKLFQIQIQLQHPSVVHWIATWGPVLGIFGPGTCAAGFDITAMAWEIIGVKLVDGELPGSYMAAIFTY